MVAANVLFYTRRASTAYNTYGIGKRVVKTLPKGSAFRIREIIRYQGVVWVKSGLGHWYEFTNDLFEDASCHRGARVYLSPYTPMMQGGGTNVGVRPDLRRRDRRWRFRAVVHRLARPACGLA